MNSAAHTAETPADLPIAAAFGTAWSFEGCDELDGHYEGQVVATVSEHDNGDVNLLAEVASDEDPHIASGRFCSCCDRFIHEDHVAFWAKRFDDYTYCAECRRFCVTCSQQGRQVLATGVDSSDWAACPSCLEFDCNEQGVDDCGHGLQHAAE